MITNTKVFFKFLLLMLLLFLSRKSFSQVNDYDQNAYKTVFINTQEWMSENLKVEHFRNGDPIPQVQNPAEWANLKTPAWCYYDNDSANNSVYGKLYNWYAVNDPRGLAPEGWRVAADADWITLVNHCGCGELAGGKLKALTYWNEPNTGAYDEYGFSALPGGYRYTNGMFSYLGKFGCFWTSTVSKDDNAWYRYLDYIQTNVFRYDESKVTGMSVRCLKE